MALRFQAIALVLCAGCASSGGDPPARPSHPTPAGTGATAPTNMPSSDRKASRVAFAWHNLSTFHGDGERLALSDAGKIFYERMERGVLLRWEGQATAAERASLDEALHAFASPAGALPTRLGVPDEVFIRIHFLSAEGRVVETGVWEMDLGKLAPDHPIHRLRTVIHDLTGRLARSEPGQAHAPDETTSRWPNVF